MKTTSPSRNVALVIFLFLFTSLIYSQTDNTQTMKRKGYDQREFTFINEYNRVLWKFLHAVDEIKDGHYKSELKWSTDKRGKITSLLPYVDNSLFTGQSMLRTLGNERDALTRLAFDDYTHRMNEIFQRAVANAHEGSDEIIRYYGTSWKLQTDVQAADVQKKGGWTKVWEAMRDLVTKSRDFFMYLQSLDDPKYPYVEAKVVTDLLPPVLLVPATPAGSPLFRFWYKVGATTIIVSEPLTDGSSLRVGDVVLGVYKFGTVPSNSDLELDPTSGAERTLMETPSIVSFANAFNDRKGLVGKTLRFLVRRNGKEIKVDVRSDAAEGGNIFQR